MPAFRCIEQYDSIRLVADVTALQPNTISVVESRRRLMREESFGFLRVLWWLWLEDGRSVISVPPGAGSGIREIVAGCLSRGSVFDAEMHAALRKTIDAVLLTVGFPATDRVMTDLCFACDATLLHPQAFGDCRRLIDTEIPPASGLWLPEHCMPDGIAYGVIADHQVVSVAYAHRTGLMEDRVADIGVETAPAYRRRGYAKTAVAALVEHLARSGGEARYACSPENAASIATAHSVGFVPYGRSVTMCAPLP